MQVLAALLLLACGAFAQQGGRPADHRPGTRPAIPTVTRTVMQFTQLETQLADAVERHDERAVSNLVADDFELRTATGPGTPVPRSEWITSARTPGPAVPSQMAVRILPESPNTALVSFLSAAPGSSEFIIDLWVNRDNNWKLAARYSSPSKARPLAKPSGKK